MSKIKPLRDWVLCEEVEAKSDSLILTQQAKTKMVILEVGKEVKSLEVGMAVVYKSNPQVFERDGRKYYMIQEFDVVGIVE